MRHSPSIRAGWIGLVGVVASNLFPLVGVAVWDWTLASLLVVYWFEALTTAGLAAVKALFAKQGSPELPGVQPLADLRAKRGGLQFRPDWPPVYPRNVPFAVSICGLWVVTVLPVSLLSWVSLGLSPQLSAGLLIGLGALVVSHLTDFRYDYINNGQYSDVSAQELARLPAQHALVLIFFLPVATGGAASGSLFVGGVVLVKTVTEAYRFYVDHMGQPAVRVTDWLADRGLFDPDEAREPPPELSLPDEPVETQVETNTTAVLLGSATSILVGLVSRGGILLVAVGGFGIVVGETLIVVAAIAGLGAIVAVTVLSRYLRFGTVEYQRRGTDIVAYDRLLGEPQWIAPIYGGDITVENAVPDRILDTGTLSISASHGDDADRGRVTLGPVTDLDAAVDDLGLPISTTSRPDTDLSVIAAAGGLLAVFAVLPLSILTVGDVDKGTAVAMFVVTGPFLLPMVGLLVWAGLSRI